MVLRRDLDAPGLEVLDRMVGTAVPERELEGLQADRPAQQLVAEADAPHRPLADELADGLDDVVQRRWVAGPVGQEDRVGVAGQQLVRPRRARVQRDPGPARDQVAHDRQLDARVQRRDPRAVAVTDLDDAVRRHARGRGPGPPSAARPARAPWPRPRAPRPRRGRRAWRRVAQVAHQGAGVDAGDRGHAAVLEPVQPAALGPGASSALTAARMITARACDAIGLHGLADAP